MGEVYSAMDINWITPQDAAKTWGITERRVQSPCVDGKIVGAVKLGRVWLIPKGATKPPDGRTKSAKQSKIK